MFNITSTYRYLSNSMTTTVLHLSNEIDKMSKHKIIQCFMLPITLEMIIDSHKCNKDATCTLTTKNIYIARFNVT